MNAGIVAEAVGLFVVTNVDDILVLSLFFGRGTGHDGAVRRIVTGQYLGFAALLAITTAAAYGATFLPESALPYLGLLPLGLGLRAGWQAWREHRRGSDGQPDQASPNGPRTLPMAAIAFANGSDAIAVYLPVFTRTGTAEIVVYLAVFLILVGVWCAIGWFVATRPAVARVLDRWGRVLYPLVLIALGLYILIGGGAF